MSFATNQRTSPYPASRADINGFLRLALFTLATLGINFGFGDVVVVNIFDVAGWIPQPFA